MKYYVWFDGSYAPKGRGGASGYGIVIKDEQYVLIHAESGFIGRGAGMGSHVAEYEALCRAMAYMDKHYPDAPVVFYGDSDLVIEQMNGQARAKKGKYLPYRQKALKIAAKYIQSRQWSFQWTPREMNSEADNLSQHHRF